MTVTRVGATKQYSDNWENIFGGNGRSGKSTSANQSRQPANKKSAKKKVRSKAVKKASRRK